SLMAEFLAPLIGISPFSRAPPVMAMRSNPDPSKRPRSDVKSRGPAQVRYLACGRTTRKGRSALVVLFDVDLWGLGRRRSLPTPQVGPQRLGELRLPVGNQLLRGFVRRRHERWGAARRPVRQGLA